MEKGEKFLVGELSTVRTKDVDSLEIFKNIFNGRYQVIASVRKHISPTTWEINDILLSEHNNVDDAKIAYNSYIHALKIQL